MGASPGILFQLLLKFGAGSISVFSGFIAFLKMPERKSASEGCKFGDIHGGHIFPHLLLRDPEQKFLRAGHIAQYATPMVIPDEGVPADRTRIRHSSILTTSYFPVDSGVCTSNVQVPARLG